MANPGAFRDCAQGAQSIAVLIAVVVGGLWTLFTFTALGSRRRAQRDLFEQAVVNLLTEATQIQVPDSDLLTIAVTTTLTNTGNRNVYLDFEKYAPVVVAPVIFDGDGRALSGLPITGKLDGILGLTLRSGASQRYSVFVTVPHKGLYYAEFQVRVSEIEGKVEATTAPPPTGPVESWMLLWKDMTYVIVQ
ncbi:MAG: hypothetical protein JWP73_98 [Phenylobacterium sp.]|nr:hypothetical protein [Phenylobacterium sp.]